MCNTDHCCCCSYLLGLLSAFVWMNLMHDERIRCNLKKYFVVVEELKAMWEENRFLIEQVRRVFDLELY